MSTTSWVTTNIRLPEDLYMDLKLEAAQKRTSMAKVIRDRVIRENSRQTNVKVYLQRLEKFAQKMAKKNPGISLSQKLIEMRYEQ